MSIGNFAKICSTMNAFVKGSNRQIEVLRKLLMAMGHFGVQGDTSFGVYGRKISFFFYFFRSKTRSYVSSLASSCSLCFKDFLD
jgi:hypothetical protein